MTYQEEEQVRLRRQGSKQAIALAMQGRWREAVAVNKSLIENFPTDVDAYNRLGRAYMELGEYSQAREAYQRAVEIAPYNTIAKKNLHRLAHLVEAPASAEADSDGVERPLDTTPRLDPPYLDLPRTTCRRRDRARRRSPPQPPRPRRPSPPPRLRR